MSGIRATTHQRAQRDEAWADQYRRGQTCAEIGLIAGVSPDAVRAALRRAGVEPRRRGPRAGRINTPARYSARDAEIAAAWRAGTSSGELARRYGVSRQRIYQIAAEAGR